MMLLTFSRRAAAEMQRRVERITAKMLGPKAGVMTDALAWSGTFHAIGARLLREPWRLAEIFVNSAPSRKIWTE